MAWPGFIPMAEDGGIWHSLCICAPMPGAGPLGLTADTLRHPSNLWLLSTEPGLTDAKPQQSSAARTE